MQDVPSQLRLFAGLLRRGVSPQQYDSLFAALGAWASAVDHGRELWVEVEHHLGRGREDRAAIVCETLATAWRHITPKTLRGPDFPSLSSLEGVGVPRPVARQTDSSPKREEAYRQEAHLGRNGQVHHNGEFENPVSPATDCGAPTISPEEGSLRSSATSSAHGEDNRRMAGSLSTDINGQSNVRNSSVNETPVSLLENDHSFADTTLQPLSADSTIQELSVHETVDLAAKDDDQTILRSPQTTLLSEAGRELVADFLGQQASFGMSPNHSEMREVSSSVVASCMPSQLCTPSQPMERDADGPTQTLQYSNEMKLTVSPPPAPSSSINWSSAAPKASSQPSVAMTKSFNAPVPNQSGTQTSDAQAPGTPGVPLPATGVRQSGSSTSVTPPGSALLRSSSRTPATAPSGTATNTSSGAAAQSMFRNAVNPVMQAQHTASQFGRHKGTNSPSVPQRGGATSSPSVTGQVGRAPHGIAPSPGTSGPYGRSQFGAVPQHGGRAGPQGLGQPYMR
eukprot:gnl/MRDRNA2_/MRDRNA2_74860_c0_seq1.p1 gnl/MRDRNA2_/MRDRNA2_74860_c0~~gnl/MRDRNA2_/MRDRNA2_74860_c0_seq1.p1  ORF type:complete len:510 (+),score=75.07 gnl/MRDRNA2_/MRDRNA2_74860_c0_seq1:78-1607(+)